MVTFLYEYFNTFAQYTVYISNNVNAKKLFSCAIVLFVLTLNTFMN